MSLETIPGHSRYLDPIDSGCECPCEDPLFIEIECYERKEGICTWCHDPRYAKRNFKVDARGNAVPEIQEDEDGSADGE